MAQAVLPELMRVARVRQEDQVLLRGAAEAEEAQGHRVPADSLPVLSAALQDWGAEQPELRGLTPIPLSVSKQETPELFPVAVGVEAGKATLL